MTWTETQRRNDWPTQRREAARTDASGPDMWVDDQPTSDGIRNPAEADWNESR